MRHRAFTLTELLIAVVVLIGVLLMVSRIFSTTQKVTAVGIGSSAVLTEAAAIETQIREDLARLSHEGVLAIRCVAVRNDVNGAQLLDPTRPPSAIIRSDQLLFFRDGVQGVDAFRPGEGADRRGQSTASRVYFGHAYQMGTGGLPAKEVGGNWTGHDAAEPLFPWSSNVGAGGGTTDTVFTRYEGGVAILFGTLQPGTTLVPQTDARQWLLARQSVIMADDDSNAAANNSKHTYLEEVLSAKSLFLTSTNPGIGTKQILRQGRVQASAADFDEVRREIQYVFGNATPRVWSDGSANDQWSVIGNNLLFYPRAERYAPSMFRVDQALTSSVMGSACSQVIIDWTYREGLGETVRSTDGELVGGYQPFDIDETRGSRQPWFGMSDDVYVAVGDPAGQRGVQPYGYPYGANAPFQRARTVFASNVERIANPPANVPVQTYEAFFGYNQDVAVNATNNDLPDQTLGFTPWPAALRITLRLHDPSLAIEGGREVQFIIDLPERPW